MHDGESACSVGLRNLTRALYQHHFEAMHVTESLTWAVKESKQHKHCVCLQCDSRAHSIHLRPQGPYHGRGHRLLVFSGVTPSGPQQSTGQPVRHC